MTTTTVAMAWHIAISCLSVGVFFFLSLVLSLALFRLRINIYSNKNTRREECLLSILHRFICWILLVLHNAFDHLLLFLPFVLELHITHIVPFYAVLFFLFFLLLFFARFPDIVVHDLNVIMQACYLSFLRRFLALGTTIIAVADFFPLLFHVELDRKVA